jgi:putative ABC transport system permease protein
MSPVAGRLFEPGDHRRNTRVAVIDERMAELYFLGEDAIGQRVWPDWLGDSVPEWYEVVGVVPHVVTYGLGSAERPSQLYLPLLSHSPAGTPEIHAADLLVRTTTPALDVVPAIRQVLADLDESLAPGRITTLDEMIRTDRAPMAFTMILVLAASLSVLILGMVGVYGSVAYSVSKRTHEIGVRMAMGAPPRRVARTILWQGSAVALMGLAAGAATARAGSRLLEGMLFEVSGTDLVTHLSVALGLFLLSLVACWIPARRASRIDPLAALRSE